MSDQPETPKVYPQGEYAIVELMGHTTLVGRIEEVERFGTKFLAIEPIFRGELLSVVFQGGPAIYRLTPCAAEIAFSRAPSRTYQLPAPILATVPPMLLDAPAETLGEVEAARVHHGEFARVS